MRVLMLSQFYAPTIGGIERHVEDLSRALVARGHEVAIATLWRDGLAMREDVGQLRIYRLKGTAQRATWLFSDADRRHTPPLPDPEMVWGLRRVLAIERPDIVHAHNWLVHSFLPLKPWSRAKLVVTLHDYGLTCAQLRLMYKGSAPCSGPAVMRCLTCAAHVYGPMKGVPTVMANWTMSAFDRRVVDMFLPVSAAAARATGLEASHLPYQVIPNFLAETPEPAHTSSTEADRWTAQLPAAGYLLYVGDLTHDKGLHVLLRAYTRLENAPPLVVIGRRCDDTPEDLPPNVVMRHDWPHDAILAAWRHALIGVFPSLTPETFGIAAAEALASGCPVVASHTGGLGDLIADGENGLLVPPGDEIALARALGRLVEDAGLRARLGDAARRSAARFRAATVVPRIERVYHDLVVGADRPQQLVSARSAATPLVTPPRRGWREGQSAGDSGAPGHPSDTRLECATRVETGTTAKA